MTRAENLKLINRALRRVGIRPRNVPCPKCGAVARKRCTSQRTGKSRHPHDARIIEAAKEVMPSIM